MKENGLRTRLMVKANITTKMEPNMLVNGKQISNMVMEPSFGLMDQSLKEISKMDLNLVSVCSSGRMVLDMKVNGLLERCMATEFSLGLMEDYTEVATRQI